MHIREYDSSPSQVRLHCAPVLATAKNAWPGVPNHRKIEKTLIPWQFTPLRQFLYNENQNKMSQASFAVAAAIKRVEVL